MVRLSFVIITSTDPADNATKKNTKLLNASRRQRIAKGSGTKVQDINKFISSFEMTQKMMKQMSSGNMKLPPNMKMPF